MRIATWLEQDPRSGEQELQETAGVGKVRADTTSRHATDGDESVGTVNEEGVGEWTVVEQRPDRKEAITGEGG